MTAPDAPQHHKAETAGHLATARVPFAKASDTVFAVRQMIRAGHFEAIDLVIVTDANGRYLGVVAERRLIEADETVTLAEIVTTDWPTVTPSTDQEHAVVAAAATSSMAIPVVDGAGMPIGVLTPKVLFEVLSAEHREDIHRLAGILRERSGSRHALEDPPLRRFGRRVPWLLVGLAMSSAATAVMASFEHILHKQVMIAFFIPAIVYLTDAIGTQTEAIAVRGLSARHRPLGALLVNELVTGGLIGLALGFVSFAGIWLVFGDAPIALGVGASLVAAGAVASGIGLLLPWILSRFGADPAFGAGPVGTILQDVLTIAIYFFVMTRILGMAGAG
jgi:magnesium transporter